MRIWEPEKLDALIARLAADGYRVIGPRVRDGAIVYDDIDELPVGVGDRQEAGEYRLRDRGDRSRFGYNLGPSTWKQYLFPPRETLFSYDASGITAAPVQATPMAFIGVRACELAAILVQDRVFLGNGYRDPRYAARREQLLVVAVDCSQAAATCFCHSSNDGPAVGEGADIVLTEIREDDEPRYLARGHSEKGRAIVEAIGGHAASPDDETAAGRAVDAARRQMTRDLPRAGIRDALYGALEHPQWNAVAERCLACANCTQVCPTCFCSNTAGETDPVSLRTTHLRRWDSCFTEDHSHVHGGPVHASIKSRYRQWLTHKVAGWEDQYGVSGCTGCGRCIAWCPVGIDLTEEVRALREDE